MGTNFSSHGGNSGTLILNSPPTPKAKAGGDADSNFMMDFLSSHEDTAAAVAASAVADESEDETSPALEDEDDDDGELPQVPQHPYSERVLMPRPLFFVNVLPPRIIEEARLASMESHDSKSPISSTPTPPLTPTEMPSSPPSLSMTATASSDSGDTRLSSTSGGKPEHPLLHPLKTPVGKALGSGDKSSPSASLQFGRIEGEVRNLQESRFSPKWCRNLEGAIDVFGFGVNPFVKDPHSRGARQGQVVEKRSLSWAVATTSLMLRIPMCRYTLRCGENGRVPKGRRRRRER